MNFGSDYIFVARELEKNVLIWSVQPSLAEVQAQNDRILSDLFGKFLAVF